MLQIYVYFHKFLISLLYFVYSPMLVVLEKYLKENLW